MEEADSGASGCVRADNGKHARGTESLARWHKRLASGRASEPRRRVGLGRDTLFHRAFPGELALIGLAVRMAARWG
jgi:hypothetical protein